jgi:predicted O-methyltransferase YrrM
MDSFEGIRVPAAMPAIVKQTVAMRFVFASDLRLGLLLRTLAATKPGGRLLELGTGTGVGTAWLLDGMDAAARLTTIDRDAKVQAVAREALGHDPRIEFITGDGGAWLRDAPERSVDLVFADGGPGKLSDFDLAIGLLKPGGLFVGDDLLPQLLQEDGRAARVGAYRRMLGERSDLNVVEIEWSSGLVLVTRRG